MTGEMLIGVITLLLITTMVAAWKLTDNMVDKTTAFVLAIAIGVVGGTIGCRLIANYFGKGLDSNNPPVLYEHSTDGGGGGGMEAFFSVEVLKNAVALVLTVSAGLMMLFFFFNNDNWPKL